MGIDGELIEERIIELEKELKELRAEYKEKRTQSLRDALQKRKEIDEDIRVELNKLRYTSYRQTFW